MTTKYPYYQCATMLSTVIECLKSKSTLIGPKFQVIKKKHSIWYSLLDILTTRRIKWEKKIHISYLSYPISSSIFLLFIKIIFDHLLLFLLYALFLMDSWLWVTQKQWETSGLVSHTVFRPILKTMPNIYILFNLISISSDQRILINLFIFPQKCDFIAKQCKTTDKKKKILWIIL